MVLITMGSNPIRDTKTRSIFMKKVIFSSLLVVLMTMISGCGSAYTYNLKHTPIKQGESKYVVRNLELKLSHSDGRNTENKTFKTEVELQESFKSFIKEALVENSILGDSKGYQLDISINYTRVYNYGGNALNKPKVSYFVKVYDTNNKLLANHGTGEFTTKYASFKDAYVNAQIATFTWDAEDEPKDIHLISNLLVEELSELGD